ncbi:hypothetical protein WUBG_00226 [Wuchereria bancrofti]|uniref:Uncharacterized protein n=1 Tax=Wuchereria bancrofti TaxID=6293 RepID=J9BMR0_WUCBA|nr:hypothetical protein WUBG_00226 [Wuchereria bancrofti]
MLPNSLSCGLSRINSKNSRLSLHGIHYASYDTATSIRHNGSKCRHRFDVLVSTPPPQILERMGASLQYTLHSLELPSGLARAYNERTYPSFHASQILMAATI